MKIKSILLGLAAITLCSCGQSKSTEGTAKNCVVFSSLNWYDVSTTQVLTISGYQITDTYSYEHISNIWTLNGTLNGPAYAFNAVGASLKYHAYRGHSASSAIELTVKVYDVAGKNIFTKNYNGVYNVFLTTINY